MTSLGVLNNLSNTYKLKIYQWKIAIPSSCWGIEGRNANELKVVLIETGKQKVFAETRRKNRTSF